MNIGHWPVRARDCGLKAAGGAVVEALEGRRLMSVATWVGGSGLDWATAANWEGGAVPSAGDDIVFPVNNRTSPEIVTLNSPVTVNTVTLHGPYYLFGSGEVHLESAITQDGTYSSTVGVKVVLDHSAVLNEETLLFFQRGIDEASPGMGLTFMGPGTSWFQSAALTYTGPSHVAGGFVMLSVPSASAFTVDQPGQFISTGGEVASLTTNSGAFLSETVPAGLIVDSDLTFSPQTSVLFELRKTDTIHFDPTTVTVNGGQIELNGGGLGLSRDDDAFVKDEEFTLIKNNTGAAVSGTFAGLKAKGQSLVRGAIIPDQLRGRRQWTGCDGDGGSRNSSVDGEEDATYWSSPFNWQYRVIPAAGYAVVFPVDGGTYDDHRGYAGVGGRH